jgi:hypothetical protein
MNMGSTHRTVFCQAHWSMAGTSLNCQISHHELCFQLFASNLERLNDRLCDGDGLRPTIVGSDVLPFVHDSLFSNRKDG